MKPAIPEKPLHIRVAEALGWRRIARPAHWRCDGEFGWVAPGLKYEEDQASCNRCQSENPPRYDTSWEVIGPLIERYGITVTDSGVGFVAARGKACATILDNGEGDIGLLFDECGEGETYLIAVCNLILALRAAGKLPKEPQ